MWKIPDKEFITAVETFAKEVGPHRINKLNNPLTLTVCFHGLKDKDIANTITGFEIEFKYIKSLGNGLNDDYVILDIAPNFESGKCHYIKRSFFAPNNEAKKALFKFKNRLDGISTNIIPSLLEKKILIKNEL